VGWVSRDARLITEIAHPLENPPPISGMQAYIADLPGSIFSEVELPLYGSSEKFVQKVSKTPHLGDPPAPDSCYSSGVGKAVGLLRPAL
jgi:hypothetical protein